MRRLVIVVIAATWLLGAAALLAREGAADMSSPATNLLFIHHSCGGQLLADPGPEAGSARECLYDAHPNGGGLRAALQAAGFRVNEASYKSAIGENTDICDWNRKFADRMDAILRTARQDQTLPAGETNAIVAFKSCFPNNAFTAAGTEPGDPDACERTVANARAAYRALLPTFARHPEVLFVAFTAPPLARPRPVGFTAKLKALFDRGPDPQLAHDFNAWLANDWLDGYTAGNVVVFDYYGILTDQGTTPWSAYPTQGGRDSHPSREGNRRAAEAFVPFLRDAWQAYRARS